MHYSSACVHSACLNIYLPARRTVRVPACCKRKTHLSYLYRTNAWNDRLLGVCRLPGHSVHHERTEGPPTGRRLPAAATTAYHPCVRAPYLHPCVRNACSLPPPCPCPALLQRRPNLHQPAAARLPLVPSQRDPAPLRELVPQKLRVREVGTYRTYVPGVCANLLTQARAACCNVRAFTARTTQHACACQHNTGAVSHLMI